MHLRLLAAALCSALLAHDALAQGGAPPAGVRRPSSDPARADSARRAAPTSSLVRGVVFDSISGVPLVGAAVQLVRDDSARVTRMATTDTLGSFGFPEVPRGRYLIGFFHPTLDSLEIETPVTRVEVTGRPTVLVDLAIPSGTRLLGAFCGPRAPGDSSGALVGWLRDAESDAPIANGRVVLTWSQVVVGTTALRLEQRRSPTRSRATGFYAACDLPAATKLLVDADADGGKRSGLVEVQVPMRGIARLDIALADTVAAAPAPAAVAAAGAPAPPSGERLLRGTARLTGTVRDASGRPIPRANVTLAGSASSALTTEEGTFSLANLPAGTRSVQVRAIGYEPRTAAVRLLSGRSVATRVVLDKHVEVLAAVNVVGKQPQSSRDLTGFLDRKRQGMGSYMTREDIEKRSALTVTDALRVLPGLQVVPGAPGQSTILGRGGCAPAVYVDGMQIIDGNTDLDAVVRPGDVRGIEFYRSGSTVPAQFGGGNNSCGTLLVWTGR